MEAAAKKPSPLACDTCRRKHLRCDGAQPVCRRCTTENLACVYTASRRGLARRKTREARISHDATLAVGNLSGSTPASITSTLSRARPSASAMDVGYQEHEYSTPSSTTAFTLAGLAEGDRQNLVDLFYAHFYPAHPILVPRAYYHAQQYPQDLQLVVTFIGCHFTKHESATEALRNAVSTEIAGSDPDTAHRVQALVLYSIVLHARHQPMDSEMCILRAARLALRLGMDQPLSSRNNTTISSLTEESVRRTWWELYTMDVYIAALHHRPAFGTQGAKASPLLPCAKTLYEMDQCDGMAPSVQDFDKRVFGLGSPTDFSFYCYRVEAIRIVSRTLSISAAAGDNSPNSAEAVDMALSSWKYNLPTLRPDVFDAAGEVDQMLFQAHCFVQCGNIFLHFPRSNLPATIPSAADIACAKEYMRITPTSANSSRHTAKAIAASKELSNLAAIPYPVEKHSPFFICGLILSCIVQLASASMNQFQVEYPGLQQDRDRVVLLLGLLQRFGETWAVARSAVCRLRIVAETVFLARDESATGHHSCSLHDSGIDMTEDFSDLSWFDLFTPEELSSDLFST